MNLQEHYYVSIHKQVDYINYNIDTPVFKKMLLTLQEKYIQLIAMLDFLGYSQSETFVAFDIHLVTVKHRAETPSLNLRKISH